MLKNVKSAIHKELLITVKGLNELTSYSFTANQMLLKATHLLLEEEHDNYVSHLEEKAVIGE